MSEEAGRNCWCLLSCSETKVVENISSCHRQTGEGNITINPWTWGVTPIPQFDVETLEGRGQISGKLGKTRENFLINVQHDLNYWFYKMPPPNLLRALATQLPEYASLDQLSKGRHPAPNIHKTVFQLPGSRVNQLHQRHQVSHYSSHTIAVSVTLRQFLSHYDSFCYTTTVSVTLNNITKYHPNNNTTCVTSYPWEL